MSEYLVCICVASFAFNFRQKISILGDGAVAVVPQAKKRKGKKSSDDAGTSKQMALLIADFGIENAKSGRASCAGCHLKISKDEVRIKKTLHDTEIGILKKNNIRCSSLG